MKRLFKDQRGMAPILIIVLIALGVVVIGGVGVGAVILSDDVSITVNNHTSTSLDIAQGSAAAGFNFLPGINVPSQIAPGETAVVQVPKRFVDSVTILTGSVEVSAFGQTFRLGTSGIDTQLSTWDGTPLVGLVGQQVDISGDHTLVLASK